jgi:hypothetical protein
MKTAILLGLLLAVPALAGDGQPDFQVEVNPNVYPPKAFAGKGVKTGNIPARKKRPDALPDKTDREAAFARVPGLDADVAGLDELDRDLLFVRARTRPLAELRKLYPKIEAKKLTRLKKEAAK